MRHQVFLMRLTITAICYNQQKYIHYALPFTKKFRYFNAFNIIKMKKEKIEAFWGEIWKEVFIQEKKTNTDYFISNFGRVKSKDKTTEKERLVKGSINPNGSIRITIRLDNKDKRKYILVHRFVADNFLRIPSDEHKFVVHTDFDKSNNHFQNLKWMTQSELNEHAKTSPRYEQAIKKRKEYYKLTESKVKIIKKMLKSEKRTRLRVIAKRFGISHTQLNRIRSGENWGNVEAE